MAVTGVNNYSNIYTNAYTGNIRKNNAAIISGYPTGWQIKMPDMPNF